LGYSLEDLPQLLLLRRPVACGSCGSKFYRSILQKRRKKSRKAAAIVVGVLLLAGIGVGLMVWKADRASSLGEFRESLRRMILRIDGETTARPARSLP
jgi:hypothetical protein